MATRNEAQEEFFKAVEKLKKEGITQGTDLVELMRKALKASGFDFSSREAIDKFEDAIAPEYYAFQERERDLTDKFRALLIEAGATEQQLEWGNFNQVRPTWRQARKIDKLGKQIDDNLAEALPMLSLIVALNEARAALD